MKPYLQVEDLTKSYGDRILFESVTFGVNEGDKIGLIAKNGTGKSTLLRLLSGSESPDSGTVTFRNDLRVGFLDQNPIFTSGASLMDEMLPAVREEDHDEWNREGKVVQILSQLGLDSSLNVDHLSGGQRKRASLARVLLSDPDILILDEPTNHLDMRSKDVLKDALKEFDGTVIVVSHDREFLDGLVDKVYEFGNKRVIEHLGGIYDFLEHKKMDNLRELERSVQTTVSVEGTAAEPTRNKLSYEARKEQNKVIKKVEKAIAESEKKITELENSIAAIEIKLATPEGAADVSLYTEYSELKKKLSDTMDLWTEQTLELEELNTANS